MATYWAPTQYKALGSATPGVDWAQIAQNWDNLSDEDKNRYLLQFGSLYGNTGRQLLMSPLGTVMGNKNYSAFSPIYQQTALAGIPQQIGAGNQYGQYAREQSGPDLGMLLPVALAIYGANAGWFGGGGGGTAPTTRAAGTVNPAWPSSAGLRATSFNPILTNPFTPSAAATGAGVYNMLGYTGAAGAAPSALAGTTGAATRSSLASKIGGVLGTVGKYAVPALNAYSAYQSVKGANKSMASAQNAIKSMNALTDVNLPQMAAQMAANRSKLMTSRGFPISTEGVSWMPAYTQWLAQERAREAAAAAQPALSYYEGLSSQYNQAASNAMAALLSWWMGQQKSNQAPTSTPQPKTLDEIARETIIGSYNK